jgi:uncharacterized protein (DUF433 family)
MQLDEVEQRIVRNPEILLGKPVIRGTRIPVYIILELVAAGLSVEQIVDDYPDLTERDVQAAIAYAALQADTPSVATHSS